MQPVPSDTGFSINNPAIREVVGVQKYGRQVYELVEGLVVQLDVLGSGGGILVNVPAGYRTDFASVPRLFWRIFPPIGRYSRAAIVHDYFYTNATGCSRFLADAMFRELMFQLAVPMWKRVLMFYAVRIGGASGWERGL